MANDSDHFQKIFNRLLEQALAVDGLTEEQAEALPEQILQGFVPQVAGFMLKEMKKKIPGTLRKRKESDAGFERRNYRRWRNPLDLLELLWIISEEVGGKFNRIERPAAAAAKDYQFEALVSLHARSLLISREILCLLYGGYPVAR